MITVYVLLSVIAALNLVIVTESILNIVKRKPTKKKYVSDKQLARSVAEKNKAIHKRVKRIAKEDKNK